MFKWSCLSSLSMSGGSLHTYGLPPPNREQVADHSPEFLRETSYHTEGMATFVLANEPRLMEDQAAAYRAIKQSIMGGQGHLFFLDAPGGTGKTFLTNRLLAQQRHQSHIALAVASSGIAATLLEGGRTAHST